MPRVNLVPIEEKQREFRRRFYIVPVAGAAILLIVMGSTYVAIDRQLANTEQEYHDYQKSNVALAPQVKELEEYQGTQDNKQQRLDSVIGLYSQRVRWSRILDDLAFVIPEDIWLDSITGEVPGLVVSEKKNSSSEGKKYDFVVNGYTNDMDTVAVMMVRLALIPALTNINLITAEKQQTENGGVAINFEVGADLVQTGEVQKPAVAPSTGEEGPSGTTTKSGSSTGGTTGTSTRGSTGTTTGSN
ncbi:fimbrial assembly protein (PilN) [bacterium BMS3Abin01]|nr:fimbrial assembly protein (PilN) [bacterium BMS3Abin01]